MSERARVHRMDSHSRRGPGRIGDSGGGDGGDLRERVAVIETTLPFLATREDVKDVLAEVKEVRSDMKIWFLRSVIAAGVVIVGWLIYLLAPVLKSFLSSG